jgi:hypothetical protein
LDTREGFYGGIASKECRSNVEGASGER